MDLTPYLHDPSSSGLDDALLSVAVNGKIALAMRGRFFLRCFCKSFSEKSHIGCAVTDQDRCLEYLRSDEFELLICTDQLVRVLMHHWQARLRGSINQTVITCNSVYAF